MKPLISVIVPVYKAEQYLEKCVSSIRSQSYSNLEIILVDDGSPGRCGQMCEELARQDDRIRVIHKENGGQSSARNKGLDAMTGDLVAFVDSDDWIEPDMLQRLYDLKESTGAQISACGIQLDRQDGVVSYFNKDYPNDKSIHVFKKQEALENMMCYYNQKVTYSLCDKLFDRNIFDGLRMTEGKVHEDTEIIPHCIERAELVAYDPTPKYHYLMTEQSTTRGAFHPKQFVLIDISWSKLQDYQNRYPELYAVAYAEFIHHCLDTIQLSRANPTCRQRREELIKQLQDGVPKEAVYLLSGTDRVKLQCLQVGKVALYMLLAANDLVKMIRHR